MPKLFFTPSPSLHCEQFEGQKNFNSLWAAPEKTAD
jgi:hypothetical protein